MDAEGDSLEPAEDRIVGFERAGEILHRLLATGAHRLQRGRIDVSGVAGGVDLNVAAAGLHQAPDDLALDLDNVGDEIIYGGIDRSGVLVIEALADAVRADQGHFGGPLRHAAYKTILLQRDIAHEAQPLHWIRRELRHRLR